MLFWSQKVVFRMAGRPGLSVTKTISARAGTGTGAELGKKSSVAYLGVLTFVCNELDPKQIMQFLRFQTHNFHNIILHIKHTNIESVDLGHGQAASVTSGVS